MGLQIGREDEKFFRVTLPYACYGVIVRAGLIVKIAPIAKWAIGRALEFFVQWVQRKGGIVEEVK
jgi:hypothetical protein